MEFLTVTSFFPFFSLGRRLVNLDQLWTVFVGNDSPTINPIMRQRSYIKGQTKHSEKSDQSLLIPPPFFTFSFLLIVFSVKYETVRV